MFVAVAVANVFHSYMQKHVKQLKNVEKLALRMTTKSWDSGFCPRRAESYVNLPLQHFKSVNYIT